MIMDSYQSFVLLFAMPLCFLSLPAQCKPFGESRFPLSHILASPSLTPEPSDSPSNWDSSIFSVLSYGAVGNGAADDTQALKMAWDAAFQTAHSVVLLVPKHYTFMIQSAIFTEPCRNGLIFQIEGSLMELDGPNYWPKSYSKRQWLVFYRINGMAMQEGGLIDGRGEKWWDFPCKPHRVVL